MNDVHARPAEAAAATYSRSCALEAELLHGDHDDRLRSRDVEEMLMHEHVSEAVSGP
jgi:hypothetical protein